MNGCRRRIVVSSVSTRVCLVPGPSGLAEFWSAGLISSRYQSQYSCQMNWYSAFAAAIEPIGLQF